MLQGHVAGKNFMRCSHEGACCGDRFLEVFTRRVLSQRQVQKLDRIDSDRSIRVGSSRIDSDQLGSPKIYAGKREISPCSSKSRTQPDQIESTLSTAKSSFCFLVPVSLKFKK